MSWNERSNWTRTLLARDRTKLEQVVGEDRLPVDYADFLLGCGVFGCVYFATCSQTTSAGCAAPGGCSTVVSVSLSTKSGATCGKKWGPTPAGGSIVEQSGKSCCGLGASSPKPRLWRNQPERATFSRGAGLVHHRDMYRANRAFRGFGAAAPFESDANCPAVPAPGIVKCAGNNECGWAPYAASQGVDPSVVLISMMSSPCPAGYARKPGAPFCTATAPGGCAEDVNVPDVTCPPGWSLQGEACVPPPSVSPAAISALGRKFVPSNVISALTPATIFQDSCGSDSVLLFSQCYSKASLYVAAAGAAVAIVAGVLLYNASKRGPASTWPTTAYDDMDEALSDDSDEPIYVGMGGPIYEGPIYDAEFIHQPGHTGLRY